MKKLVFFLFLALFSGFLLNCSNDDNLTGKDSPFSTVVTGEQISSSSVLAEELISSSSAATQEQSSSSEEAQISSSSITAEEQVSSSEEQVSSSSVAIEDEVPSYSSNIKYSNIAEIYLGSGYDVINSSYINRADVKLTNPVLNVGKMYYDGIIITDTTATEQKFETFAGTNVSEFYKDKNASISVSYSGVLFSGKFSAEFKTSSKTSSSSKTSYVSGRSYRYTQDDYIVGTSPSKLSNYLTEEFVNDLKTMSASRILDIYGTHILVRYYKGGSLEFNYTYSGSELTTSSELKFALKASYAGISGNASYGESTERKELEDNSEFIYYTRGGKSLASTELTNLMQEYGEWTSSINNYADICGIGDFNQSLVPIWDLAKAGGYADEADELESEFNERVSAQAKIFADIVKAEQKAEKRAEKRAENEAKKK